MNNEFNKYKTKGGAYHWDRISSNPLKRNLYSTNIYKTMIGMIPTLQNKKLLDIGCGDATLVYLIDKEKGGDLYGIDNNQLAIKLAKEKMIEKKFHANLKTANCYDLPFPDNYFDYIISSDVIEHLERPKAMLREAKKKLKNEGVMIHATPIRRKDMPVSEYHEYEFSPREYQKILSNFLGNVKIIKINPFLIKYFEDKSIKSLVNAFCIFFKINPYYIFNSLDDYTYMVGIGKNK